MMRDAPILTAEPFANLPDSLRHRGAQSPWAKMTRPGQPIDSFLEGAFFDAEGSLILSDVPYGRIFGVDPGGTWRLIHDYEGEPHAMRIASDGRHIVVDYGRGLLDLTAPDRHEVMIAGPAPGEPFMGLSDLCFGPDGRLWFTDSGRTSLSDPAGRLYCLSPDGVLRCALDAVPYANGVAASPDGSTVYVAATRGNAVWRLSPTLPEEGTAMAGIFLNLSGGLGPDGLATNSLGWLAIAQAQAGRAYVVTQLGDPVAEIRLPRGLWTTSVAFHPDDPTLLYIVDAEFGAIFTAKLQPPGE